MNLLQDVLVVSDLDGTLIGPDGLIPKRNLEAITRFQGMGGHFTLATGRSLASSLAYVSAVLPNSPGILLNGTVVYDFHRRQVSVLSPMSGDTVKDYISLICDHFPGIGVEVFSAEGVGVLRENDFLNGRPRGERKGSSECVDFFDGRPLCKVLFSGEAELIGRVASFAGIFRHSEVQFVLSSENYLEMVPSGVNKGTGLKKVIELCGFSRDNVYAIGDYYNDTELLESSGFAAVPENAPDPLKSNADLVVCGCAAGAVADLIAYIIETRAY